MRQKCLEKKEQKWIVLVKISSEVLELAPLHALKKPKAAAAGKTLEDYGSHLKASIFPTVNALNFPYSEIDSIGKVGIYKVRSACNRQAHV
jgi:hypothetical protein